MRTRKIKKDNQDAKFKELKLRIKHPELKDKYINNLI